MRRILTSNPPPPQAQAMETEDLGGGLKSVFFFFLCSCPLVPPFSGAAGASRWRGACGPQPHHPHAPTQPSRPCRPLPLPMLHSNTRYVQTPFLFLFCDVLGLVLMVLVSSVAPESAKGLDRINPHAPMR